MARYAFMPLQNGNMCLGHGFQSLESHRQAGCTSQCSEGGGGGCIWKNAAQLAPLLGNGMLPHSSCRPVALQLRCITCVGAVSK